MTNRNESGPLKRKIQHANGERGSAILPALVVVVIVATLSMIFLQLSLAKNKEQRSSVDAKRAFYMAEAGLSEGFDGLCIGKSGNVASKDLPAEFGNGLFWVTATENGQGRVTLESTGLCGAGRATLSIVVERQPDTVAALGFFGDQGITVEPGALIDSYDSRAGLYVPLLSLPLGLLAPTGARVGCNSDITVNGSLLSPSTIYGDVRPGPTGTLFRSRYATISGSMAPSTSAITLPSVKLPAVTAVGDFNTAGSGTSTNLARGVQGYDMMYVKPGASLRIVGPAVLVVKKLVVDTGGKLLLDASGGPIKMYVVDGVKMATSSTLASSSTDPLSVSIQVAGSVNKDLDRDGIVDPPVTINSTGNLYGNIYAPGAAMTLPTGLSVFGAVTAKSLTIKTGGKLHFDRALTTGTDDSNGAPRLLGWRIVELPNVPVVKLRFDALRELRAQGLVPLVSRDAHLDIGILPP